MALRQSLLCLVILAMGAPGSSLKLPFRETDACHCLGWADTYRTKNVPVGAVFEMGGQGRFKSVYKKIEDAVCLNKMEDEDSMQEGGEPYLDQWCYVSSKCPVLGLGHRVNNEVSWKDCRPGFDDMTRNKTVEELIAFGEKHGIMVAPLAKMAYPTVQGKKWDTVKKYFQGEGSDSIDGILQKVPNEDRGLLDSLMHGVAPVIFDSSDNQAPYGILEGHKIFTTELDHATLSTVAGVEGANSAPPTMSAAPMMSDASAHMAASALRGGSTTIGLSRAILAVILAIGCFLIGPA